MIRFTVFGKPQPQGSSRAFIPKGWKRAIITSDNPALKSWRQELAKAAMRAAHRGCPYPRGTALTVHAWFYFAKPKSVRVGVKNKTTKPDADKLLRAALDGMSGIIYHDDSQVTEAKVGKSYGMPERAEITVYLT